MMIYSALGFVLSCLLSYTPHACSSDFKLVQETCIICLQTDVESELCSFGARHFYRKQLVQDCMLDVQVASYKLTWTSLLYKILEHVTGY